MSPEEAAAYALSLPGAVETPHFEMRSFRVGGRIFATLPADGEHLHVFLDEHAARAHAATAPDACEGLWWGRRLVGVRVRLAAAEAGTIRELLQTAWERRAPRRGRPAGDSASGRGR